LKNNLITCIENVPSSVEELDLTNNKLTKVDSTLTHLKKVNLSKNQISDSKVIHKLISSTAHLTELQLDSNPFLKGSSKENNKLLMNFFDLFTSLQLLDGK
jgi:Leucine-rich repeat (LRR) protein